MSILPPPHPTQDPARSHARNDGVSIHVVIINIENDEAALASDELRRHVGHWRRTRGFGHADVLSHSDDSS